MYTTKTVFEAIQRAVDLAARLPGDADLYSPWPDIRRFDYMGHNANEKKTSPLTAAELQEYETTLSWVRFIRDKHARIVLWAYVAGVSEQTIAKTYGPPVSQASISQAILWGLGFITYKLNVGEAPPASDRSSQVEDE